MDGKVSFVIPLYNEADSLELLYQKILDVANFDFEILFVDDGSTDNSVECIKALIAQDSRVRLISFRRNMGKAMALQSGFRNCRGEVVITMDADLQDEPAEVPLFLAKLDEGYDVVSGWKYHRNDPLEKRAPSRLFNKVTSLMSGVKLHDFNCGFKAYRRQVVDAIDLYGDLHRYIPVLAARKGFSIAEVKVRHNPRQFGKSKYGVERYLRGFFDALTVGFLSKFYNRPMHLFGRLGLLSFLAGFVICGVLTVQWFLGQAIGTRPLLTLGVLAILVGVQLFSTGLIGDMIVANSFKANYDEGHVREKL